MQAPLGAYSHMTGRDAPDDSTVADLEARIASLEATVAAAGQTQAADYLLTQADDGTVHAIGRGALPNHSGDRPMAVAQAAYDDLATGDPGHGVLRFAPGEWTVAEPLQHYQQWTLVTAPGAIFRPAPDYDGYIFDVRPAAATDAGPSGQPEHVGLSAVAIDGDDRSKGVRMVDLKHSWVEDLYVLRASGGPGLDLAGSVRECVVRNLQLWLCGGTGEDAALKIAPDPALDPNGDATNGVYFFGGMISYSTDRSIWAQTDSRVTNFIRHVGFSQFQIHAQEPFGAKGNDPPASANVTFEGVRQPKFLYCNLRNCGPGEAVVRLTDSAVTGEVTENALFFGCDFSAAADDATGLALDAGAERTRLLGNTFGRHAPIDHAIDWADGEYTVLATANSVDTDDQTFFGVPPANDAGTSIVGTDTIDLGMAETWHDGRLDRRLTGSRTMETDHRKAVPQGHTWTVASGDPIVERGRLELPAGSATEQTVVGPRTPFHVTAGTVAVDVRWDGSPTEGAATLRFFAADADDCWRLRWTHDATLALERTADRDSNRVLSTAAPQDGDWHTIAAHRTPDATWALRCDGDVTDSTRDEFLPDFDGAVNTMALSSTADVPVGFRDLVVY
jgi:hypothetical protein